MARKFSKNLIYKATRGNIYDDDHPKYNCYMPVNSGSYEIFDVWVCDEHGNIHPGYNVCGVPVPASHLGRVVGEYKEE